MSDLYNGNMKKQKKLNLIKNIITITFLVIAVIYFYQALRDSLIKVMSQEFSVNWIYFSIAMFIYFAYFVGLASLWHYVTTLNKSSIPYPEAMTCYAYSILGKYIPGEIFMLIARFRAYERRGIRARKVTVNFYIENLGTLLGAAFLFIGSLFFFKNDLLNDYKWVLIVVFVLLIVCTNPKIINLFLRLLERIIPGKDLQISITYKDMAKMVGLFICNWILVGCGFYLLVCSVYPIPIGQFLYVAGVFGLAVMVGMVTFFAPSGLGVREGIITLGLTVIMPKEEAVIIALLARVWATFAELLFILIIYLIRRIGVTTGRIKCKRILRIKKVYKKKLLQRIKDEANERRQIHLKKIQENKS